MAKIELYAVWSGDGIRHNDGTEDYERWSAEVISFDTVLRTLSSATVYQNVYLTPVQDTPPSDLVYDPTVLLVAYVSGPTEQRYYHNGAGGLTIDPHTLTLTSLVTGSTCFGGSNGSIDLQVSGLVGPYTFLWDDGPTTQNRGPLPAGRYRVAVTATPSGAIARLTVQVGTNPEIDVVIQKVGGAVSLVVTGGVGPYTYLWSDGSTLRDRTGLVSGPYSCTITDALSCTKTIAVQVSTDVFYWSRNPITLALDAGAAYRADPTTKPNLTFLCEVWVERDYLSGTFTQVGTALEQPADREGRTTFEVQALLDVFLQHHVPPVGATRAMRADPMFRRFYLKYAESYGATPVRAGTTVLTQNYVVLGGLNFYEARSRTFDAYQDDVMPFLTWEPPVKPALPDQPEYLYYLVQGTTTEFNLHVRVLLSDHSEVHLDRPGATTRAPGSKAIPGAEVKLQAPDGSEKTVYYFSADLSDWKLATKDAPLKYVRSLGPLTTYVKSATYLMHKSYFSKIRNLVLERSNYLLQDDSGIAMKYFPKNAWQFTYYGTYRRPINLFAKQYQPELTTAYHDTLRRARPLPFGTGYNWRQTDSNLLLAKRKTPLSKQ